MSQVNIRANLNASYCLRQCRYFKPFFFAFAPLCDRSHFSLCCSLPKIIDRQKTHLCSTTFVIGVQALLAKNSDILKFISMTTKYLCGGSIFENTFLATLRTSRLATNVSFTSELSKQLTDIQGINASAEVVLVSDNYNH